MGNALRYLAARTRLGIKFGLGTIRALVEELGHPERAYPTLLVAGTNGKGSVVVYVDAALRASGLRVGRYTSPHLLRVNERICVDGRAITDRALDAAVSEVSRTAERLVRAGRIPAHPTYFEALTAAAFLHFRSRRVDVAVLEVGMGGRLDATNVSDPLASAVVSVARDHEKYLGRTLPAIAREKAGVLRPRRATVLGPLPPAARAAIAGVATPLGARLVAARQGTRVVERKGRLDVSTPRRLYRELRPLAGAHQHDNLVVALRLVEEAEAAGLGVHLGDVAAGVARVRWPGRLQWIRGRRPLLLDGAHNPAGAEALATHVEALRPFVLLFGVMADKDVAAMARTLFPLADEVVLTRPRVARAATPAAIARKAGGVAARARRVADPRRALGLARRLAGSRPVVVAGSLYLVGEVLGLLRSSRK